MESSTGNNPPPEKPKKTYRSWPKKQDGTLRVIDRDKLRLEYLGNPFYEWKRFCNSKRYKPFKPAELPIKRWQQEWLQKQSEDQEESVVDRAVNLRIRVIMHRLDYVEHWGQSGQALRGLLTGIVNQQLRDASFDQENIEAIQSGTIKPRLKLTPMGLSMLANAAKTIQEVQLRALLIPKPPTQQDILPIPERTADDRTAEVEEERLRNLPVSILGAQGVSPSQLTKMLSGWYDQAAETQKELKEASPGNESTNQDEKTEDDNALHEDEDVE